MRSQQSPNVVVPSMPPTLRVPADDATLQATNAALVNLIKLLGSPAQDGSLAAVLQQLATFGAQPFVPNMQSASILEIGPSGPQPLISPAPQKAFRVWGGYIAAAVRTNASYSGTGDLFYSKIYTQPPIGGNLPILVVAHIELSVGAASQHDSDALFVPIPGVQMPANSPLLIDVNGGTGLGTGGVLRVSGNIFFSVP